MTANSPIKIDLVALDRKASARTAELVDLPIISTVLRELTLNLSPELTYHSVEHTEDVIYEAVRFALFDGLEPRKIELIAIAAAYHDAGFLDTVTDNESYGAARAKQALLQSGGYSSDEIEMVCLMIMDTRIVDDESGVQQPSCPLSCYLLDADLANLGREDCFKRADSMFQESGGDEQAFWERTKKLVERHSFLTRAAQVLRGEQKAENLIRLQESIKTCD